MRLLILIIFLLKVVFGDWCVLDRGDGYIRVEEDIGRERCKEMCEEGMRCIYTTSYSYYNEYMNGRVIKMD